MSEVRYPAGFHLPTATVNEFSRPPDYTTPAKEGFSLVKEIEKMQKGKRPGR